MLAALTAQRLSQADDDRAELWGCAAKARRDLSGLLYADGIHDSLYRAAGRTLITKLTAGALLPGAPVPPPLAALEAD